MAKKKRKFKTHGVMALANDTGIEIMIDSSGDNLTARIVIGGEVKEYHTSEIFYDEEADRPYFVLVSPQDDVTGEVWRMMFYLDDFIRVGVK